jgi:hypothetical protein
MPQASSRIRRRTTSEEEKKLGGEAKDNSTSRLKLIYSGDRSDVAIGSTAQESAQKAEDSGDRWGWDFYICGK